MLKKQNKTTTTTPEQTNERCISFHATSYNIFLLLPKLLLFNSYVSNDMLINFISTCYQPGISVHSYLFEHYEVELIYSSLFQLQCFAQSESWQFKCIQHQLNIMYNFEWDGHETRMLIDSNVLKFIDAGRETLKELYQ